jgi:addiction module HigA family antidote
MHNPPHPGLVVKDVLIEGAELSVTDAADRLGVTRGALSNLINCHTGISPEMAVRLSILLVTSSEMWLNLQKNYDLWKAEHKRKALAQKILPLDKAS